MKQLKALTARIDGLKTRERIMVLAVLLALVGFAAETFYLDPARKELARERGRVQTQQTRLADLTAREAELMIRLREDPDVRTRERILALREDIAREEEQLEQAMDNLVSPADMTRVLADMIPADARLELVGVRSLPTKVITAHAEDSGAPRLYKRGVELQLTGEYLALLTYLKAIESSRWRLHWDVLKITTEEYPRTMIDLRVHTLTLDAGWIGM